MIQEKLKAADKSKTTTHVEATPLLESHDGCVPAEEAFALKSQIFDLHNKVTCRILINSEIRYKIILITKYLYNSY